MSLFDKIAERRIDRQAEGALEALTTQIKSSEGPYWIEIGRTPFTMSTLEHMRAVSGKVLEGLGGIGVQTELEYCEDDSIKASTTVIPGLTGYTPAPKSKPTLVFQRHTDPNS